MMYTNNAASCVLSCALLSALLLTAEGRAAAEEKDPSSLSANIAGVERKHSTAPGSAVPMEPVVLVANISEASNVSTEPIKVLAKLELLNPADIHRSPLVSVVLPTNANEPIALVAKVSRDKPVEIHANVPLNAPVKVITEVAPDVPEVALIVHRGMRAFSQWKAATSTTRGMFNVNFK